MKGSFYLLVLIMMTEYVSAQDSAVISSFTRFPEELDLSLKPVFEVRKKSISNIFFMDSLFYFRNTNEAGACITAYSLAGKMTGKEYIKRGSGINQVAAGMSAGSWEGKKIWIHDILSDKIVIADGFDRPGAYGQIRIYEHKLPLGFYWLGMIDDDHIAGAGVDNLPDKLHEVELSTGKVLRSYGSYNAPPAGIPFNSWKMAYQSFLFVKPGGNVIALACRFADKVEFFNRKDGTDKLVNGPENFDVVFRPIQTGDIWTMERINRTRFAFLNGVATDKYLFLLYAGHQHEDPKRDSGKYIFVYDWDGNPVRKINLGTYISTFTVSQDGKLFYCDNGAGMMLSGELPLK